MIIIYKKTILEKAKINMLLETKIIDEILD